MSFIFIPEEAFRLLISVMRIWKNAPRNCSENVLLWRNMLLLCKAFYRITLIKCQNRTKIFSQTHFIFYITTIPWDNVWLSNISWNSQSLEIRLRLWKKCWLHCECIQIVRTFARKLCNCRWIKIRRDLEKLEEKHWYAATKSTSWSFMMPCIV